MPTKRLTTDPYKQSRKTGSKPRPPDEWIAIPVPAVVDEPIWSAVQEQLNLNSLRSCRNNKRHEYLLRGLVRCPRCGGDYTGYYQHGRRGYRCQRAHWTVSSTGKRCAPGGVTAQLVEDTDWQAVSQALQEPHLLIEEYQRRAPDTADTHTVESERKQLHVALNKMKAKEDRVTDAYINEAMELDRYKGDMKKLKQRREDLEKCAKGLDQRQQREQDSRAALEHLEQFCRHVSQGLDVLTFEERQQLLRLVVESVTVENGRVRVETVIPTRGDNLRNPLMGSLSNHTESANFRGPWCWWQAA